MLTVKTLPYTFCETVKEQNFGKIERDRKDHFCLFVKGF
jgi:hypothetical protein